MVGGGAENCHVKEKKNQIIFLQLTRGLPVNVWQLAGDGGRYGGCVVCDTSNFFLGGGDLSSPKGTVMAENLQL